MTEVSEARAKHAAHSVLRERIVEHVFVGEAMRRLWQLGIVNIEILRAEFDATGYDVVMCCGSVMRHVQFKVSLVDGVRAGVTINQRLAQAPSGCVIWLGVDERLEIKEYRWFGAAPGRPLPDVSRYRAARHTRANAMGFKVVRVNQRILAKSAFEKLSGLDEMLERLFAVPQGGE
ncbi:hypothetical protein [Burkholderia gladioli]|uniref:hypothetical protein n=1 Tax=Burkholderia gladioli TaxID=28095 RepID=UPI000BBCF9CC|nr:hypothetical protein [Burkholderia gladioli]ATF90439.1 hypothetical protein CO712_35620 [Burkholderia gladioli pv. gladioli]MBJ9711221.1 hypothetical protein [Burkholderia gladioli]MCH7275180.1 hypothetical protein [Burkholderia gladioli]MDN7500928.1 hypothetical protein [Burkholderia gladioli]MDR8086243.1 hypothetical protein [Burkholderia gladioli]